MTTGRLATPFLALWRNEWDRLWARKRWTLIAACAVFIVAGGWFAARTSHGAIGPAVQPGVAFRVANVRAELASDEANAAASGPGYAGDESRIAVAVDRWELSHGMTRVSMAPVSGWQLPGDVMGGTAVVLLALVVAAIAGDSVSSERQDRTLPLIFLHTAERRRAFAARALAAAVAAAGLVVAICLGLFVWESILTGVGSPMWPQALGERYALSGGQMVLASAHAWIVSQEAYDLLGMALTCLTLAAWAVVMTAASAMSSRATVSVFAGIVFLISPDILSAARQTEIMAIDPATHFSLMADWLGSTAQELMLGQVTLGWGAAVWAVCLVAVGAAGMVRFARLEP